MAAQESVIQRLVEAALVQAAHGDGDYQNVRFKSRKIVYSCDFF